MEQNQFGKVSVLHLNAGYKDGKTYLQDVHFTAPYKIMRPFERKDGGIQVMLLAASAGIMEGDRQEFQFQIQPGADVEFISQSYDKIHAMKGGCAKRFTHIRVASHASFCFNPQPTIPFADSAFENRMVIDLEDATSAFQMSEIFSCGRYASGERFAYEFYHNLVEIRRGAALIYRDNTRYDPKLLDMAGLGMYEGYTHLLNLFLTRPQHPDTFFREVREYLLGIADAEALRNSWTEISPSGCSAAGHSGWRRSAGRFSVWENFARADADNGCFCSFPGTRHFSPRI